MHTIIRRCLPFILTGLGFLVIQPLHGQFSFQEGFTGDTAPGWEFLQDGGGTDPAPRLTGGTAPDSTDPENGNATIDATGTGWLRLATTTGNQSNAVALDVPIPSSSNNIKIGFDYTMWGPGSSSADGLTVFLWDAAVAFDPGAFGGSLGYAQRTGIDGLAGGFLGVGLDVYGNFSNDGEGRSGAYDGNNLPNALNPNQIVVRGPDTSGAQDGSSGFAYVAGTGGQDYTAPGNPSITGLNSTTQNMAFEVGARPDQDAGDYRYFEMELDASNQLTVRAQFGYTGTLIDLFTTDLSEAYFDRPDQLRIGFGAATGGEINVHEIRNLSITASGGADSFYWDDENGNALWGTGTNWDQDTVPTDYSTVIFSDQFPDTLTTQTVNIDGGNKILKSMVFTGATEYTLDPTGSQTITLERDADTSDTGEKVYITVLNSANGNADHTINANIILDDEGVFQNLVDQTLTLTGTVNNQGNDLSLVSFGDTILSGVLSGGGDLTKKEVGTAILSGNNTYSGLTTIEKGILQIENNNALGNSGSDTIVQSGGTLGLANNITTPLDESVDIAGSGQGGIGAITNVSGVNTWRGDVDLTANSKISSQAGTLTFSNDNTIDAAGNDLTIETASGSNLVFQGDIFDSSGTSDLIKTGTGTATIATNTNYSGETIISAGTLRIENVGALGTNAGDTTVESGATLEFAGTFEVNVAETFTATGDGVTGKAAIWGASGTSELNGTVDIGSTGASFGAATGARIDLDGNIFGSGDAKITGDGIVVWASPMSYTGDTLVESGTLLYRDSGNRINDASDLVISSGATLDMASSGYNDTVGSLAGGGTVLNQGATLTAGANDNDTTWSGNLSGSGNFIKEGSGAMTVTGTNTMTGELRIDEGTVNLGTNNAFADSMDLRLNGGTFATSGFTDEFDTFILQSSSTLDFNATPGGYLTFDDFTRTGGTLTIDDWAGNVNSGNGDTRLQVTASTFSGFGAFNASTATDLNDIFFTGWGAGANVLDMGGGLYEIVPSLEPFFVWDSDTSESWNVAGNWQDSNGLDPTIDPNSVGAKVLFSDKDGNLNGTTVSLGEDITVGTLVFDNDSAAFTISSSNNSHDLTFEANQGSAYLTVISGGSVTIDRNVNLNSDFLITNESTASAGTIIGATPNGTTLDTNGNNVDVRGDGTTIINSKITEGGILTKSGDGTLRLTGSNSYSGGTDLQQGTLQIGNSGALGGGNFTINGGTIESFGASYDVDNAFTIADDFTVQDDATTAGLQNFTLSGNGTIAAGFQTVTVNEVNFTMSGEVTGTGQLIKSGDGTMTLSNDDSTFSGGLIVNEGLVETTITSRGLQIGSVSSRRNYLGTGDITVNAGATLQANLSTNDSITLNNGVAVTNNGGNLTFNNTSTGTSADFNLGTSTTSTASLNQTAGTTTITVGDDFNVFGNSSISVSGGTMNLNPKGTFLTSGTSGNAANINVSNGAALNVDLSGTGGDGNFFTLGQYDNLTLNGETTGMTITGDASTAINLNGKVRLEDGSTLTVNNGTTFLGSNTRLEASGTNPGTLQINDGNLSINEPLVSNRPNIAFNNSGPQEITAPNANSSILNLGTVSKTGSGTLTINSNVNNIDATTISITEGTLLLGASDQLANTNNMTLGGGTFATGGNNEILNSLTLTTSSILDMGNASSILQYTGGSTYETGTLTINNWSGTPETGGGTDQIIFGKPVSQAFLSNIYWADLGISGAIQLATGEIVPVIPEPSTWFAGGMILLAAAVVEFRRRKSKNS